MNNFAAIDFETTNEQSSSVCSVGVVVVWQEIAPLIEGLPLVAHNWNSITTHWLMQRLVHG